MNDDIKRYFINLIRFIANIVVFYIIGFSLLGEGSELLYMTIFILSGIFTLFNEVNKLLHILRK